MRQSNPALVVNRVLEYYPRLRAVADYVGHHLDRHIALTDVARVAGLERKYFSTYFHSKSGIRFTEWLRQLRVNRAKDLIEHEDYSIPRLAFASGFRDLRSFERAFKRYVGMSPSVYRTAVRPNSKSRNLSPP